MYSAELCLTGFALVLIHLEKHIVPSSGHSQCLVSSDKLAADCCKMGLTKLPDDLNEKLWVLNISSNPIEELTNQDFARYNEIRELVMWDLLLTNTVVNLFEPLTKLQVLDISYTYIGSPPAKLPSTLLGLYADGLGVIDGEPYLQNFEELNKLIVFTMAVGDLQEFPNLAEEAPLVFIDLSGNPLSTFSYSDIAVYCLLEELGLEGTLNISHETCCGLDLWMKTYNISSSLTCSGSCGGITLESKSIEVYEQCRGSNSFFLYVQVLIAAILILVIFIFIFKYFRSAVAAHLTADGKTGEEDEEDESDEKPELTDEPFGTVL